MTYLPAMLLGTLLIGVLGGLTGVIEAEKAGQKVSLGTATLCVFAGILFALVVGGLAGWYADSLEKSKRFSTGTGSALYIGIPLFAMLVVFLGAAWLSRHIT
jgi:hypothetical protein